MKDRMSSSPRQPILPSEVAAEATEDGVADERLGQEVRGPRMVGPYAPLRARPRRSWPRPGRRPARASPGAAGRRGDPASLLRVPGLVYRMTLTQTAPSSGSGPLG